MVAHQVWDLGERFESDILYQLVNFLTHSPFPVVANLRQSKSSNLRFLVFSQAPGIARFPQLVGVFGSRLRYQIQLLSRHRVG